MWDLYCGGGAIGLQAAAAGAGQTYGIDISAESIAQARENAERNGLATAEFVDGDVARQAPVLGPGAGADARLPGPAAGGADRARRCAG